MKLLATHILYLLTALSPVTLSAENIVAYEDMLRVTPIQFEREGERVEVVMEIDITHLTIHPDRFITLIPFITDGSHIRSLPPVQINGSRRQKVYQRSLILGQESAAHLYALMLADEEEGRTLTYQVSADYEPWMQNSRLDMDKSICGCGGTEKELLTNNLYPNLYVPFYEIKPQVSFITPQVEEKKQRDVVRDVFLDFPVAQTKIYPDYGENKVELARIKQLLIEVSADPDLTITAVNIKGYASPEGSEALNLNLSKKRAEALKDYLIIQSQLPTAVFKVGPGGENWEGLKELVESSDIILRDEILEIIGKNHEAGVRKKQIAALDGGRVYSYLLHEFYPRLRKAACRIDYEIREFTLEEGREVIKRNPSYLSLQEMFMVANSYGENSKEYAEIMEIAATVYPDDSVANVNVAALYLRQNKPDRAKPYLNKGKSNEAVYLNNLAVYYLLTEEYDKAGLVLTEATAKGSEEARHNLNELMKKLSILK